MRSSLQQPVPLRLITIATPQISPPLPIRPRRNFRRLAATRAQQIRVAPILAAPIRAVRTRVAQVTIPVPQIHAPPTPVVPGTILVRRIPARQIRVGRDITPALRTLVRQALVLPTHVRLITRAGRREPAVRVADLTRAVCVRLIRAQQHHAVPTRVRPIIRAQLQAPVLRAILVQPITHARQRHVGRRRVPLHHAHQRQVTRVQRQIPVLLLTRAGRPIRVRQAILARRIDAGLGVKIQKHQRHGSAKLPCRCA